MKPPVSHPIEPHVLATNLEEVPPVAVVTKLIQREHFIILSAVSIAIKTAGHPLITLANVLNLDATQNHFTEVSETREARNKRTLFAIHSFHLLYNS